MRLRDLTGQKFNKLTVIGKSNIQSRYRRVMWDCVCDCGGAKSVQADHLTRDRVMSCGCIQHLGSPYKGVGDLSGTFWNQIEIGAKRRHLAVEITIDDAWQLFQFQLGKCALSGVELTLTKKFRTGRYDQTASLDRIDSSKGYIAGNVQWVHRIINRMKLDMDELEFKHWCNKISSFNKSV